MIDDITRVGFALSGRILDGSDKFFVLVRDDLAELVLIQRLTTVN